MVRQLSLIFAAALALAPLAVGAAPAKSLEQTKVFVVYEPVYSMTDVAVLERARPELVCRGWFKWNSSARWETMAPIAQAMRDRGIAMQGGITCAAVYPGENGIDDATFRDFTTTDLSGAPYFVRFHDSSGWYHLSLYNPKVIEYLKRDVRRQIDAGVAGVWYDEVEGYYDWNPTEGYDAHACAAFRDWLIRKYCVGQGWKEDDPRWRSVFGIDLARHGGSMRTFDYREHLRTTPGKDGKPLAADPPQGSPREWATSPNPLYREWGYAWDRRAKGTFRYDTVAALFTDLLEDANRYAREKHGRTLINTYNHNNTARPGVEFLQPHNGAQPPMINGRLKGRASYMDYYERTLRDAAEACPGVPVVFFVDWPGEVKRLVTLPRTDQIHFFALYIPEAYAAGGEFALPLRGFTYNSVAQGTLGYLCKMADFYREHFPWLRGSTAVEGAEAPEGIVARARRSAAGTAVHLINHRFSTNDVLPQPASDTVVSIPWKGATPPAAYAVSPDFPEQMPVSAQVRGGRLHLRVPRVTCSTLVLLPNTGSLRRVTGTAAEGTRIQAVSGQAMAVARDGRFTLFVSKDTREVECLETGQRLPMAGPLRFTAPSGEYAAGLLLDNLRVPLRGAALQVGNRRFHTDPWGRFRVPLSAGASLRVASDSGEPLAIPLRPGFTAWQIMAEAPVVASFAEGLDGFWANWHNKETSPEALRLSVEEHAGKRALKAEFLPVNTPWRNANGRTFATTDAQALEITYAGDGSAHSVNATLQAHSGVGTRFYHARLSLASTAWVTRRIPFSEFRTAEGQAFDAQRKGNTNFQLSAFGKESAGATIWLHSARLVTEGSPLRELWRADGEPFHQVDVERLREGHLPLYGSAPRVTRTLPLMRLNAEPPAFFVNWDGKGSGPVLAAGQIVPGDAGFLRATFPAGTWRWANLNFNLPLEKLTAHDGLRVRLRTDTPRMSVRLSLHVSPGGRKGADRHEFYIADIELEGTGWEDVVLPWDRFRDQASGERISFQDLTGLGFQIVRPDETLSRPVQVDIESLELIDLEK